MVVVAHCRSYIATKVLMLMLDTAITIKSPISYHSGQMTVQSVIQ